MSFDEQYMRRALLLAARGRAAASPNPMVGAVVVRAGRIVGEGYHRRWGGAHAEIAALEAAGRRARGAALYVTLEPCGHHGRTPPCAEAVRAAGLRRVVYAAADPNPLTRGKGPRLLRAAGLRVESGLLRDEARDLNAPYYHWRRSGRPWVVLKWAMTLDGKIATRGGESRWITGAAARRYTHGLRRRVDAVLVGTETARRDDPHLGARPPRGRFPLRIVLDRRGRLPLSLGLFQKPHLRAAPPLAGALEPGSGQTVCVLSRAASRRRREQLRARGVYVLECPVRRGRLDLERLLERLGALGVSQLLVEGGGEVAGTLVASGSVQEVVACLAPRLFGGTAARGPVEGPGVAPLSASPWLASPRCRRLGSDFVIEGRVKSRR